MSDQRLVDAVDPEAAFGVLADATRVDILRALWDAEDPMAFSALREAVGVRDSGQFNYHLDKLVDRFVAKGEDGYELTLAGRHVVGAIHAGAYTMDGEMDPITLDRPCSACGGTRTFRYEDEAVEIDCDTCEMSVEGGVSPGVFAAYERGDAPSVTARYMRTIFQHVDNGFCWHCEGRVTPSVVEAVDDDVDPEELAEADPEGRYADFPMVEYDCGQCGATVTGDLGGALLDQPPVVAFHYDHGIDVRDRPFWDFSALTNERAWIRERDPLRAVVTYPADDEELALVVDDSLDVLDVERRPLAD
jgi:DNA-binding transcriptional ArsR family regulator